MVTPRLTLTAKWRKVQHSPKDVSCVFGVAEMVTLSDDVLEVSTVPWATVATVVADAALVLPSHA